MGKPTDQQTDFSEMDNAGVSKEHWKIMFISGMGFFTDAYDLFIIGVVMALLKSEWHISPTEEGLVASTALLASAFGAILFGRVADMLGRKRIYGYEVLVLAFGAVASALAPSIWWLILFRVVLGVGIGGEETRDRRERGLARRRVGNRRQRAQFRFEIRRVERHDVQAAL